MSIDQRRHISFSAYIGYDFLDCTGKFAENVLRIFPPFHVDFFLPMWPLLSKPLYISMRRRKKHFLVYKVIRDRSMRGRCQFLIFITKHLVKFVLSFVWKHERIYMEEIWKSEEFVWKCEEK